jgi:hypothetical protein
MSKSQVNITVRDFRTGDLQPQFFPQVPLEDEFTNQLTENRGESSLSDLETSHTRRNNL